MSEPEPIKEEMTKENESAGEKTPNVPESTSGVVNQTPENKADAKPEQKSRNFLVMIGVIVVILVAAAGAFIFFAGSVATNGDTVTVYYTEAFENGTVISSNMNSTPLLFTLGNSSVISGIQEIVTGMSTNETKTVILPYTQAYGAYNPALIQTLNRTGPIANQTFVVGQSYRIHYRPTNSYSLVKIINVTPKTITWDANNPLAGYNLTFTIKLAGIQKA